MQRYFSKEKYNNEFVLNKDDIYHITRVMRMKQNEKVEVVYNNEAYICTLNENYNAVIESKMESKVDNKYICLIVPLLKESKMDLILQKSAELGVNEIIPVVMERSVIKLDNSKEEKRIERWSRICKEAAEQSKRTDIPVVTKVHYLNELENLSGEKLICSTSEKSLTIKKFLTGKGNCDRINLVIGPEGGISSKEEEMLVNIGFTRVSLGSRIMRVETVPLYLLSIINYEFME